MWKTLDAKRWNVPTDSRALGTICGNKEWRGGGQQARVGKMSSARHSSDLCFPDWLGKRSSS